MGVLKANPGLIVGLALLIGAPLVLTLVYLILGSAAGKPVMFIGTLMGIVILPFVFGQLVLARRPAANTQLAPALATEGGRFVDRYGIFGPDVDTTLVQDVRAAFPDIMLNPVVAELATFPTGEMVLAARFADEESAKSSSANYWRAYQVSNTSGDETRGWRGKRGAVGDYIEMLRAGPHLFIWTGLDRESLHRRRLSSATPKPLELEPLLPALQPVGRVFQPIGVKILGILFLVLLYTGMFFKGAGWAGRTGAVAAVPPVPASTLRSRLLALDSTGVPIALSDEGNRLRVEWRYADARWADHARLHALRKTHRLLLSLDEGDHTVRVTEQWATFDTAAGTGIASLRWHTARGIVFAQKESERGSGVTTFDLAELKRPLIEVATRSGWNWQPVLVRLPKVLRWLE